MTWSFPDKDAIIGREGAYGDEAFRRLSYRLADQIANQFAHGLLARGLTRGDVVLLCCENSVEGYLIKIATAKAGLVCAPINPMMAPDMLSAMIKLVTPKLAVVDAELWPAADRESVRVAEHLIGARDFSGAVAACEDLLSRVLAAGSVLLGGQPHPRDPVILVMLLGLDGIRYMAFRSVARGARVKKEPTLREALDCYAFVAEARRALDRVARGP